LDRQPILEGDRLQLRPLIPDDWEALYGVASDPLIWEVHPAHDRWQEPVFRAFFADALAQGGAIVVIDKNTGAIVGSSRWQDHDAEKSSVEIGWTFLARSHWGGSHNRELKRLMVAHALRWVERAIFAVGEGNLRSRRAMEKIGGKLAARTEVRGIAGGAARRVFYEIDREGFANGPLAE
jgi:RimJ/RimL family protein N-acetyltransferase